VVAVAHYDFRGVIIAGLRNKTATGKKTIHTPAAGHCRFTTIANFLIKKPGIPLYLMLISYWKRRKKTFLQLRKDLNNVE
jgi:predicted RecB family nuclease